MLERTKHERKGKSTKLLKEAELNPTEFYAFYSCFFPTYLEIKTPALLVLLLAGVTPLELHRLTLTDQAEPDFGRIIEFLFRHSYIFYVIVKIRHQKYSLTSFQHWYMRCKPLRTCLFPCSWGIPNTKEAQNEQETYTPAKAKAERMRLGRKHDFAF